MRILWIVATPQRTSPEEIITESRCIISPISTISGDAFIGVEEERVAGINIHRYYHISPVVTTEIQSNYSTTVPKSFFPDYEGKSNVGVQQPPLFNYGEDVYFVNSPVTWRSGKSFYMLNEKEYVQLFEGDDDGDFIFDGGRNPRMSHFQSLDEGEVLDIQNNELIDIEEAIECLEAESEKLNPQDFITYDVFINSDGYVNRYK